MHSRDLCRCPREERPKHRNERHLHVRDLCSMTNGESLKICCLLGICCLVIHLLSHVNRWKARVESPAKGWDEWWIESAGDGIHGFPIHYLWYIFYHALHSLENCTQRTGMKGIHAFTFGNGMKSERKWKMKINIPKIMHENLQQTSDSFHSYLWRCPGIHSSCWRCISRVNRWFIARMQLLRQLSNVKRIMHGFPLSFDSFLFCIWGNPECMTLCYLTVDAFRFFSLCFPLIIGIELWERECSRFPDPRPLHFFLLGLGEPVDWLYGIPSDLTFEDWKKKGKDRSRLNLQELTQGPKDEGEVDMWIDYCWNLVRELSVMQYLWDNRSGSQKSSRSKIEWLIIRFHTRSLNHFQIQSLLFQTCHLPSWLVNAFGNRFKEQVWKVRDWQ